MKDIDNIINVSMRININKLYVKHIDTFQPIANKSFKEHLKYP